jgi:GT2 family glycosyltransferase
MVEKPRFSLSVSIVLYKTPMSRIAPLLLDLERAGAAKIVVVDNSPFSSIEETQAPSPIVEEHRTGKNIGFGRAQNIAIGRSADRFKYHLICNPDIVLSDDVIPTLVEFMDRHTDVGVCMPKLLNPDGTTQFCCRRSPVALDYLSQIFFPRSWGRRRKYALEMRSRNYDAQMEVPCLSGCFLFFRSDVLRRLKGFDERFFLYFEDFDLSLRSQSLARNVYLPSASVIHERQSEHRRSWYLKWVFAQSAFRYFCKWGWVTCRAPTERGS